MLIEEGMTFGRWTVIGDVPHYKNRNPYIECRCSCGGEYDVRTRSLRDGTSTRCKLCKQREHADKLRKPDTGWNVWYYRYQGNAKSRNLPFNLSKEEFVALCLQDCEYCGSGPVDHQVAPNTGIVANGVDRIDPAYGYQSDNTVPCCGTCNKMKMAYDRDFFLQHAAAIYKHNLKKRR